MTLKYLSTMKNIKKTLKRVKNIIAVCSLLVCIAALACFFICLIAGLLNELLMWSGLISFFAWAVFLPASSISGEEMEKNYNSWLSRHRH